MPTTSVSSAWVRFPKPNPQARLRLFCLPYAGSGAWNFCTWPEGLPASVEVCSVELPGRATRLKELPFTELSLLVQAMAPALLSLLDKPFAFFGHSMGGLLSFELVRLLRREYDRNPIHLFVSGRRAPQVGAQTPPLHTLPEAAFIEELRCLNGTPEDVLENAQLRQLLLPILRADFAVLETYQYRFEAPLDCPITALGGLQDSRVKYEDLKAWQEQTSESFSLHLLPGDHFFMHSAQPQVLQILSQSLSFGLSSP
jgi:medium-chain acyl-[acyl-carrier-protein] hydrolase